jgi:Protein of unknown function
VTGGILVSTGMDQVDTTAQDTPAPRRTHYAWVALRSVLMTLLMLVLIVGGSIWGVLALTGRNIHLPDGVVARIETRINATLPGLTVDLGGVDVLVDDGWVPRLALQNMVLQQDGRTLIALPDTRVDFDGASFAKGALRPASLRISGAQVALTRDAEGRFDLSLGQGGTAQMQSFAQVLDAVEAAFAAPALQALTTIEVDALSLTLTDVRTDHVWQVGDGRLVVDNRAGELAAELRLSLLEGATPAQAVLTFVTDKTSPAARITATVENIAASDLAAQAGPLAFLAVLDAPISGQITAALGADGGVATLQGTLDVAAGAITPNANTAPIAFESATIGLSYDPTIGRITLGDLSVDSRTLRLKAVGHADMIGADGKVLTGALNGRLPAAFVTQMQISDLSVDPEGQFAAPVSFTQGALDLRLTLDPFRVEVGQLSLVADDQHLLATGEATAGDAGWTLALDVGLDTIAADRLVALWPLRMVPKTRAWLADNVQQGTLFNVNGAVRLVPGTEPRLSLGYEFTGTQVRFLRSLPPIDAGAGYATLEGRTYTIVLDQGTVTPPEGGAIDAAGSVFRIADITQRPNVAQIDLNTRSSLTATLSLLDQPPFRFMTKADRPVALGTGEARVQTRLTLPLGLKVQLKDVDYDVTGQITDVRSDVLVPGRVITADALTLKASPAGMTIAGPGRLGQVPFDVTYSQGFGPEAKGRAQIAGTVTLSDAAARDLGLGLPDGMVSGQGAAEVTIDLRNGEAARLTLVSSLRGVGLSLPDLGWSKARDAKGRLEVEATLGTPPAVSRIALDASGLRADGSISLRAGGGLDEARFDRVRLDDWLDAGVTLTGQGKGAASIAVTDGTIDLRAMPDRDGGGGGGGSPFTLRLDRLQVSDNIAFTDFRGEFSPRGGLNGSFTAGVNGVGTVAGTVVPAQAGSAVRIQSEDAGSVMAAAGIFASARGGSLDLQLTPRGGGSFDGRAVIERIRVRNASALTELLNAISVVGLLEQLNGQGIVFNNAEVDFILTPNAVQITKGSATGISLGVSMAGVYQTGNGQLDMQGVVSPIYLVNGVGAVLTRRGEGLFGFNYRLGGTADDPQVSVNPLSILTPGMFRDIFRRPPPVLGQ